MPICDRFSIPFCKTALHSFARIFPNYGGEVTVTVFYGLFLNAVFHNLGGISEGTGISAFQRRPQGRPDEVQVATVELHP